MLLFQQVISHQHNNNNKIKFTAKESRHNISQRSEQIEIGSHIERQRRLVHAVHFKPYRNCIYKMPEQQYSITLMPDNSDNWAGEHIWGQQAVA